MSDDEDLVVLICPPGASGAPISYGTVAWEAYREEGPGAGRGRWLVRVPREVARHFCGGVAGFTPLDPGLRLN